MIDWIAERLRALPTWGIGLVATAAVTIVVGGAVAGYRTYDYIEHDNEFCLSCHLMVEPYELFAKSAHRDMGCKACHKPTFAARSQMALTQIVENPDSLRAHAEVPNEKCASCHIDGDPDKWESIANSAGHRIHLESDDPVLEGLNCVECHSSSLHQFTAASETCAQSDCHVDSDIQLGGMGELTIHCTACHGFSEPVGQGTPFDDIVAAVQPDADACLSCHAMRVLVDMPEDEPHDAVCGACHNPHEQALPEEAVQTCATSACHASPAEASPMHRGLGVGVLANCTQCHEAHDWHVPAEDCVGCHGEILDDGPPAEGGATALHPPSSGPRRTGVPTDVADPAAPTSGPAPGLPLPASHPPIEASGRAVASGPAAAVGEPAATSPAAPLQAVDTTFSHRRHRNVECTQCHSTEDSHGGLRVTSLADCRSCHHTQPTANDCTRCHEGEATPGAAIAVTRDLSFSVGDVSNRSIDFEHAWHTDVACGECHTAGLELSASAVDCASCHEDHHQPDIDCTSCHEVAPDEAHPLEVHTGCTGAGCHEEVARDLTGVPRTRDFCQACHQDLVDHRPEQNCVECHQLPTARGGTP